MSWAGDRKIIPTETSVLVGTWCTMSYLSPGRLVIAE